MVNGVKKMTEEFLPIVKSPSWKHWLRKGKGFSIGEIKAAGINTDMAAKLGIPIDKRRKTVHEKNVENLKKYYQQFKNAIEKSSLPKVDKKVIEELTKVPGVNIHIARILAKKASILSIKDLVNSDVEELSKRTGYSKSRIRRWITAAENIIR